YGLMNRRGTPPPQVKERRNNSDNRPLWETAAACCMGGTSGKSVFEGSERISHGATSCHYS
ncbi:MAG: hypothetical protein II295_09800, partial [Akkermansia sp.]|nr:hypothetical protein [Akkermansia sp.]